MDNSTDRVLTLIKSDLNLSIEEIEEKYDTNHSVGLDEHEAQNRLEDNGANVPPSSSITRRSNQLMKLFNNIIGMHNFPLWCGAVLCFIAFLVENHVFTLDPTARSFQMEVKTDNLYISIGLLAFIMVFGIFSYYMEAKCEYYVESCRDLVSRKSTVIREGIPAVLDQSQLVVGDLVILHRGDELAADVKLIECSGVRVHQEMLGEVERHYYGQLYGKEWEEGFFQAGDVLFCSTFISMGHGKGIVLRTQNYFLSKVKLKTLFPGSIKRQMSKNKEKLKATNQYDYRSLKAQIDEFLHTLSLISFAISATYGVSIYFLGYSWIYAMMFFIAHYVGIITEALIPTFQVAKAQGSKELAYKNCYMQNIEALETLGTTSVICTNKTGVITQSKMIVGRIWIHNQEMASFEFMRQYKAPHGTKLHQPVESFVRACALCVFAQFSADSEPNISPFKRNAIGKPSEVAVLRFMEAFLGTSVEYYQKRYHRLLEVSFNATRKCSFKVYEHHHHRDQLLVCIKGQPEELIQRSKFILTGNGIEKFHPQLKDRLISLCNEMGKRKYRTLAVAQALFSKESGSHLFYLENGKIDVIKSLNILDNPNIEIQFLGMLMLENPVRLSVPDAIFTCRRAGINVIMTTADHPQTALSIAKTVGIVLSSNASTIDMEDMDIEHRGLLGQKPKNIYTGEELNKMTDAKLKLVLSSVQDLVFARITSEDKERIVDCCREMKEIVAVTGIGSSDLPVFEKAHVRLSMGQYGADIAKRNCDVILLDDNFSSIVFGIEQGRVLFENIRKSLCYTLSSKPVELIPYLLCLFLEIPAMAGPIIILAIDLITDNLPPIALGYEVAESYVMDENPKYFLEGKIVNFETIFISLFFYGIVQFLSGFFSYVVVMADNGFLLKDLIGLRGSWLSKAISDLPDSYGQEWTYQQRNELEQCCQTLYFATIAVTRIGVLFSCRTRKDSCLGHLFSNSMVNFSIFFLMFFALFLSYYSPFQYTANLYPLKLYWWFLGVPFLVLIMSLEESRKFIIRRYPKSSVAQIVYY